MKMPRWGFNLIDFHTFSQKLSFSRQSVHIVTGWFFISRQAAPLHVKYRMCLLRIVAIMHQASKSSKTHYDRLIKRKLNYFKKMMKLTV